MGEKRISVLRATNQTSMLTGLVDIRASAGSAVMAGKTVSAALHDKFRLIQPDPLLL